ncbi:MAG: MBOAT family O-acyltransferase [Bacteroidota bacterium]
MLFSSPIFLYLFLPLTLLAYYLINRNYRNYLLLFASLIFFAWGGVSFTVLLIGSIALNYLFGLKVQHYLDTAKGYRWLVAGVATNVLILGVFKYANFIVGNLNQAFGMLSIPMIPQTNILLPIGISFYTFHSLSYLVDIYRRKTTAQRNIFDLALYIAMFSQLIAGPIIRYSDVWTQLRGRIHTSAKFTSGIERFLIGLGKKVLLANTFAVIADKMFTTPFAELDAASAWLGLICYSLQIYCDFAGYSDMAIGLGRMFGFEFLENFNFPYIAKSVKEFWRRWHISLSSFFRDYVYIPLGGSHVPLSRTYLNLLIVFFLTGFWHGASWSFVVWGLFHGFFMVVERIGFEKVLERIPKFFAHTYTLLVVLFAWVLFRADTLTYALGYWEAMFRFALSPARQEVLLSYVNLELILAFVLAILGSFGVFKMLNKRLIQVFESDNQQSKVLTYGFHLASAMFYASVLILCSIYLIAGTYNPFIYYRF